MKKRLAPRILTALAVVFLLAATAALAGEYHFGTTLYCQECHVMHYSQSHDYSGNPTGSPGPPAGLNEGLGYDPPQATMKDGPTEKLLRDKANALCLSCHDGQAFAPDVQGAQTAGPTYFRAGGALTAGSDYNGHTMYYAAGQPTPGTAWTPPSATEGFRCVDCHEPHGYVPDGLTDLGGNTPVTSQYRNLRTNPGVGVDITVSYNAGVQVGTYDSTRDVFLRSWSEGAIAANYVVSVMDINEPDTTESAMGLWCGGCHGDFHDTLSDGGAGVGWLRHPTADANIGGVVGDTTHSSEDQFGGHAYRVKVMSPDQGWGTQGTTLPTPRPTNLTPTCLSCHKAHGSEKPFGLIYAEGAAELGESGDGDELNDLCRQCHVQ